MGRLLCACAVLAAMWPYGASADASGGPSPSPSLQTILVPPAPQFVATPSLPYKGEIGLQDYAATWGPDSTQAGSLLNSYGYVDGYGMSWTDKATGHQLAEFVLAFQGGRGATQWLYADQSENVRTVGYQHADSLTGVATYYGVHLAQASPPEVLDGFEMVKGNDVLGVLYLSPRDDVLAMATSRAESQYNAAPEVTIPVADWPENNQPVYTSGTEWLSTLQGAAVPILVIAIIAAAGVFFLKRRGESTAQVAPESGASVWNGTSWLPTPSPPPPGAQVSPDGRFWWDGQTWRPTR